MWLCMTTFNHAKKSLKTFGEYLHDDGNILVIQLITCSNKPTFAMVNGERHDKRVTSFFYLYIYLFFLIFFPALRISLHYPPKIPKIFVNSRKQTFVGDVSGRNLSVKIWVPSENFLEQRNDIPNCFQLYKRKNTLKLQTSVVSAGIKRSPLLSPRPFKVDQKGQ